MKAGQVHNAISRPSIGTMLLLGASLAALFSYWGWQLYRLIGAQVDEELPDLGSLVRYLLGIVLLLVSLSVLAQLNYRLIFRRWMDQNHEPLYYWSWTCVLAWILFEALQWRTGWELMFVDENILVTLVLIGLITLYGYLADAWQTRRHQQQLVQQKTQAELTALRAQINPHFLFNALNTIYNEAQRSDNESVADLISQLAGIMRFTLLESSKRMISIEQEFQFLEKYLALQRARLPALDTLQVQIHLDWDGIVAQLPPLLLIPIVENMFQYGLSITQPTVLRLEIRVVNRQLDLLAANPLQLNTASNRGSGLGIHTTRQRLDLLYPNRHQLTIEQTNGLFRVLLHIDL